MGKEYSSKKCKNGPPLYFDDNIENHIFQYLNQQHMINKTKNDDKLKPIFQ